MDPKWCLITEKNLYFFFCTHICDTIQIQVQIVFSLKRFC